MRGMLLAVAFALAVLPGAGAHGEDHDEPAVLPYGSYLQHLKPWDLTLEPGANASQTLAFKGAPLSAGWLLVFHGVVNGTVQVAIEENGTSTDWVWAAGEHVQTMRLQTTGLPVLTVQNVGASNVSLAISYDQTCDCIGKSTAWERGPLFFNVDAAEGDTVRFRFGLVPVRGTIDTPPGTFNGTLEARVQQVVADESGQELTVLETWTATNRSSEAVDCTGAERFNICMDVAFAAPHDGRQVLLMEAGHGMEGWVTQVRPVIDVGGDDRKAPLPPVAVAGALCFALAALLRPRT